MSHRKDADFHDLIALICIVFVCACMCLFLEISANIVPSMLLHRSQPSASQGDILTFWGRTRCDPKGWGCYTVDAVEPKVLIPVLTALCATAIELVLLVVLCILKCCSSCVSATVHTEPVQASALSESNSNSSFSDGDSVVKKIEPFSEEAKIEPFHLEPSRSKLYVVLCGFILLFVATQVVSLVLGIAFYEMEHKKYSDCWEAYGNGFYLECMSLAFSLIAFFSMLDCFFLVKSDMSH